MDQSYTVKQKFVFLVEYDGKIINIPYRNVYQRTWKLVDCKIYNSSTRGKSIQNQSTTPFGRCGLTLDWFTTREIVIDFAIHQLLGPLISTMCASRCFLPLTGFTTLKVNNDHAHVITQGISNKFIEVNFCVGCMVSLQNRRFQRSTAMSLIIR